MVYDSEEAEVEADLEPSNESLAAEEILASVNSRTLDPIIFERTPLSQIAERSERSTRAHSQVAVWEQHRGLLPQLHYGGLKLR